jgi:hypothetical protein
MRAFIAKHWGALSLALLVNFPSLWKGVVWVLEWAARLDFIATHAHGLPGVGGLRGFITNPPPWTVFVTGMIGVLIVLWDIRHPHSVKRAAEKNRMAFLLGATVVCLIGASTFGFLAYRAWKYPPPPQIAKSDLLNRAETDFMHSGGMAEETETINYVPPDVAAEVTVKIWIRYDLTAMASYLVFYVPQTLDIPEGPPLGGLPPRNIRLTFETLKRMADKYPEILKRAGSKGSAGIGDLGTDNWRYSTEARFNGAIYIYYEGSLTETERVTLRQYYKDRGAMAFFRDRRYVVESRPPERR